MYGLGPRGAPESVQTTRSAWGTSQCCSSPVLACAVLNCRKLCDWAGLAVALVVTYRTKA